MKKKSKEHQKPGEGAFRDKVSWKTISGELRVKDRNKGDDILLVGKFRNG